MQPPKRPPCRGGKRGERRGHASRKGDGGKRQRGRPGGGRGTPPVNDIGGIRDALPSPQHGLSKASPHGM